MTLRRFNIPGPWPGGLSIIDRPRTGEWLADDIACWKRGQIDSVISALTDEEMQELGISTEVDLCARQNIQLVRIPIRDRGVPDSLITFVDRIIEAEEALYAARFIAIHCRAGIGRSGLIAAAILVRVGVEPDSALKAISTARRVAVPDTDEQRNWLIENALRIRTATRGSP